MTLLYLKSWGDGEIDNLTTALAAMETNENFSIQ